MPQHSTADDSPSVEWLTGYQRARRDVACFLRSDRGRIVVTGAHRRSYLQGLLTNDIEALGPGRGCYAAYLTPQGRMIADLWVHELGDLLLLTMAAEVTQAVLTKLDQFIFSEDVQVGDVSQTFAGLVCLGPQAHDHLARMLGHAVSFPELPEGGNVRTSFHEEPAVVVRTDEWGVPSYEALVPIGAREALWSACIEKGGEPLSSEAADALRIEAGIPVFHRDMDEDTIPLEAGLESRAISQTKGCYVGQEVIVRVLHRGHGRVARRLVGLVFDTGEVPERGMRIGVRRPDGDVREVGHVTSATFSPRFATAIALGSVHRDFAHPGTPVQVGDRTAVVSALPFP